MADTEDPQKPIVISDDAARGADDDVPKGDTLVPMLVWGVGLAVAGVIAALVFMNTSH